MKTLQRSRDEATAYRLQEQSIRTSVTKLAACLPLSEISPDVLDACAQALSKADLLNKFALIAESQA